MSQIETHIVLGKNLSAEDLRLINEHRHKEFQSKTLIAPSPDTDDWEKPYFLVNHGDSLLAFGRLHTIGVSFKGTNYEILGIATIVAIEKGHGYGRLLMERMKEFIKETGKTAVGFCNPSTSPFYEKCGFGIVQDGKARFECVHENGTRIPSHFPDGDVLYLEGKDGLMQKLIEDREGKIIAFHAPW